MVVKMNYLGNFRGASTMKNHKYLVALMNLMIQQFVSDCLNILNKLKSFKILTPTNEFSKLNLLLIIITKFSKLLLKIKFLKITKLNLLIITNFHWKFLTNVF